MDRHFNFIYFSSYFYGSKLRGCGNKISILDIKDESVNYHIFVRPCRHYSWYFFICVWKKEK